MLAKIGFDTVENDPCKACQLSARRSPREVFITSLEAVKPEENDPLVQSAGAGAKDKRGTVGA